MNATGSEYGAALSKFEGGEDGNDAASPAKDFEEDISSFLLKTCGIVIIARARERFVRSCAKKKSENKPFRRRRRT